MFNVCVFLFTCGKCSSPSVSFSQSRLCFQCHILFVMPSFSHCSIPISQPIRLWRIDILKPLRHYYMCWKSEVISNRQWAEWITRQRFIWSPMTSFSLLAPCNCGSYSVCLTLWNHIHCSSVLLLSQSVIPVLPTSLRAQARHYTPGWQLLAISINLISYTWQDMRWGHDD